MQTQCQRNENVQDFCGGTVRRLQLVRKHLLTSGCKRHNCHKPDIKIILAISSTICMAHAGRLGRYSICMHHGVTMSSSTRVGVESVELVVLQVLEAALMKRMRCCATSVVRTQALMIASS